MKSALLAMDGQGLRAAYRRLTDMLGGVFSALQKGREALTTQVSALWGGLERGFSTTIATVRAQADAIGKRLGAAAEAAGARLSGLWDGLRKRAEGMSGIAGAAARLVTAAIDRLLASARALWSSIQARFETVRAGLSRVVASITEKLGGAWDAVQRGAGAMWSGITRAWGAARGAVESLANKAEAGVGEMLGNFKGFTIDPVVDKISKISGLVKAAGKAAADPESAVAPVLNPIIARLEGGMPAAGHQKLAGQAGGGAKGGGTRLRRARSEWAGRPGPRGHARSGKCPVGVTTRDAVLELRLDPAVGAKRLRNYLRTVNLELTTLARACGKQDVHHLEKEDLVALTVEADAMAGVPLAGRSWIPGRGVTP
jgi:hypothetical protein